MVHGELCLSESLAALIYFTDVEEEYEVKFLRRSGWGGFTFPNVADVCDVANSNVVLQLPCPQSSGGTARAGRQLSFPVDLTAYKQFMC